MYDNLNGRRSNGPSPILVKSTLGATTSQLLWDAELDAELEAALSPYFYTVQSISIDDVTDEVQGEIESESAQSATHTLPPN
jgi:hypothetical protein